MPTPLPAPLCDVIIDRHGLSRREAWNLTILNRATRNGERVGPAAIINAGDDVKTRMGAFKAGAL